jgi:hypothetical protein
LRVVAPSIQINKTSTPLFASVEGVCPGFIGKNFMGEKRFLADEIAVNILIV